jgi:hypothetical protein
MEKILVQFAFTSLTAAQYDRVWEDLRQAGFENPDGMIHHFGAFSDTGWLITEVWESEQQFNEFGKTLMPFLEKNAVPITQPIVLTLYNSFSWG